MTSIRRLPPGLSSAITRASSLEVSAPARQKETVPVEPVRTGFSEQSDFQPSTEDVDSLLFAHTPLLAGRPGEPTPEPLRSYTGASDFQARAPRYGHLLGTHVPPPGTRSLPTQGPGIRASSLLAGQARPSSGGATLEQARALAGPEDQVLRYPGADARTSHSVVRHADGRVTDPSAPRTAYADTAAWERAHPRLGRPTVLSPEDVELVLDAPEGPARDELLAYFAPEGGESVDSFEPSRVLGGDPGFTADLGDLPLPPAPEDLLSLLDASSPSSDFTVQETDVAPLLEDSEPFEVVEFEEEPLAPVESREPARIPAERLQALSASESLDTARDVAASGSPEEQAQVATALYTRGQTADGADAATYQRAAALAASGSPEATQALLSQVGEANVSAFVRTVLRAADTASTSP
jgi:hypothetical protein